MRVVQPSINFLSAFAPNAVVLVDRLWFGAPKISSDRPWAAENLEFVRKTIQICF
jgi:hypothetical protein